MDDDTCGATGHSRVLRNWDEMDESLLQMVEEQVAKVPENKQRRVLDAFLAQVPDVFGEAAERIVVGLFKSAPEMLGQHQVLDDTCAAEVAERWGDALDVYRMLWVSCHETGGTISDRHFNVDDYEPPPMLHAQVGLQARACPVAHEVFVLLRAGLGAGALARARTLHEIATISTILATHGTPDGDHPDLAERYLLHANVVNWLDAAEYQEVAPKLGYEPLDPHEMSEIRGPREEAIQTYGKAFGKPNGWAACLTDDQRAPTPQGPGAPRWRRPHARPLLMGQPRGPRGRQVVGDQPLDRWRHHVQEHRAGAARNGRRRSGSAHEPHPGHREHAVLGTGHRRRPRRHHRKHGPEQAARPGVGRVRRRRRSRRQLTG